MSDVILVLHTVDRFKNGIEFQSGCLKVMLKRTCIFPPPSSHNNNQLEFAKNKRRHIDTRTNVDNSLFVLTYQV